MCAVFSAYSDVTTIDGRVCGYVIFDLDYPQLEQPFGSAGTREIHPHSAGRMATLAMANVFVSFLMGLWGSAWSGKRMQDGTQPRCATALCIVSTRENFSYVCMVGINSHFKVLAFLCWAAWIRHLVMLRYIDYVFTVDSCCLCF